MPDKSLDVVAIGNAIVDVLARADQAFLDAHGMVKGSMQLVDEDVSEAIYADMGPATETSGGSAANTAAGLASFHSRVAFVGKVRDDQLGEVFAHDIRSIGVEFDVPPATDGPVDGALPGARHPRRAAHDEHLPRAHRASSAPTTSMPSWWLGPRSSSARATSGTCPMRRRRCVKAMDVAAASGGKVALLAVGLVLRRAPSRRVPRAWSRTRSTSSSPTRPRSARSTRPTPGTRPPTGSRATSRSPASPAASTARPSRTGDGERLEVPAQMLRRVVDTTGAGDLYAVGLPARLDPRASARPCAGGWPHWRRPR